MPRFQDELRESLRAQGTVYKGIRETGDLDDQAAEQLNAEIERVKARFQPGAEAA